MVSAALRRDEIAGGKYRDAGDFQIGGNDAAAVRGAISREMLRQHPRLLVGRFDQPVADAAMLGAFAERENIRRTGLQLVVDDDAAIDRYAGVLCQRDVRANAGGENHRIGVDPAAVGQFDCLRRPFRHGDARCWH